MCDYPTDHNPSPVTEFIAVTFITDGVQCFYGLNDEYGARNNLSLENFKDIQEMRLPLKLTNSKGETKSFTPVSLKYSTKIAISMNHSNIYCVNIDGKVVDGKEVHEFKWADIPDIFKNCQNQIFASFLLSHRRT